MKCGSCIPKVYECVSSPTEQHRWNGWPGATCIYCFCEDPLEVCLADNCECKCHDAEKQEYEKYVKDYEDRIGKSNG